MITLKDEFETVLNTSIQPYRWDALSRIIERHVQERTADLKCQHEFDLKDLRKLGEKDSKAQDEIGKLEEQMIDLRQRISELEAQLETVKNATCLTCGRSLAPDGDCYGCEVDRLDEIMQMED